VLSSLRWPGRPELPAGNAAWTFMIHHPFGEFALFVGGLASEGDAPKPFEGLARVLSLDMRVIDPAWIGMKLRKLLNYAEPLGYFMAFVPGLPHGERRQQTWPSTVAYLARLIIHRYAMLGVLTEEGFPVRDMGVLEAPADSTPSPMLSGKVCPECGNPNVIHKDGCDFCTACGY